MTDIIEYHEKFNKSVETMQGDKNFTNVDLPKLKQAAQVHGYRGASKKKHNGIVPIRPSDTGLLKSLKKLTGSMDDIINAMPIKVVAHVMTGDRLVGYRFPSGKIVIYGVANYAD